MCLRDGLLENNADKIKIVGSQIFDYRNVAMFRCVLEKNDEEEKPVFSQRRYSKEIQPQATRKFTKRIIYKWK